MSASATKLKKDDSTLESATLYLADRAYMCVLGKGQPVKLRQVMKGVGIDGVTMRLIRHVMNEDSRFECVDRRWIPSARLGDKRQPVERSIHDLIASAGAPVAVPTLARELAEIYGRPSGHFEEALPRMLSDTERYFSIGGETYGLAEWLLVTDSEEEEDVIFDSFLSRERVEEFSKACPTAKWKAESVADTAAALVKNCKQAVPIKILALFAWRELGEDFDAADFYARVASDERVILLSDQNVCHASAAAEFTKALGVLAEQVAELPIDYEEEEAEGPVVVTDTDKEEIVEIILSRGGASAEELLESVLEVSPDEPAFAGALESLGEALKADERVMWIGGTRWSKAETFPDEVYEIPAALAVPPSAPFETPEGDVFDQELEEEGFDGDLKAAVYDPLAEDVTDEDSARTMYQPDGESQRCVLKYHHKTEGTFPLCQVNPDFFGPEPEVIPVVLADEGKRRTVYVNNSTRIIYGLRDFYSDITEVSGAAFYIEKTSRPGEYRFRYDGEIDEQLHIDTGRSLELLDLKARFESTEMPLYDVIKEILSKQGMTFPQIVNEVNIVKRCSRLLVASILSSYHAFHTRGKSNIWQFDSKKESQGFNKAKRKYIRKDQE